MRRRAAPLPAAFLLAALAFGPAAAADGDPARPGGDATSFAHRDVSAFSQFSGNLSFDRQFDFKVGDGIFRKLWVSAPSSTKSSDGLGPLYNARGCQSCHLKDGRGHPAADGEQPSSLLYRLALGDGAPDPVYGRQLQTFAIQGHPAEVQISNSVERHVAHLAAGRNVTLEKSVPHFAWNYGTPGAGLTLSPRIAPPMIGMGLLEAIPEADILAREDPDDRDGDGIRGVANRRAGRPGIGRFGWKAGAASVAEQTANAFLNDIGLGTAIHPQGYGDCTQAQAACRAAPHGDDKGDGIEVPAAMFDLVVFYSKNLAVPHRPKANDPAVRRGEKLFADAGCSACHVPRQHTGAGTDQPHLANQTIYPYTDLLLHDMGKGLADGQIEDRASGRQWRTPPLWGLGLTKTVSGHDRLLHDGRAHGPLEAILWHDGEAHGARARVAAMKAGDLDALLAFLDSL
ncbi:MAG: c-type cytochrome [Alphaproteobacteria bacterium]|nr:c-type cytochrome [Alphaproteobacteria bacterium]